MKLILKTIWTVVILVMMNNAIALEVHETDNHEITWFSTSTNTLLNRSSTALATQHVSRPGNAKRAGFIRSTDRKS
jgi:hypothetical protein